MILSRLGDLDAAEEHLPLDIHGLDRRRTRAIVLAGLGTVRLRQGDVGGGPGARTWQRALTSMPAQDGLLTVQRAPAPSPHTDGAARVRPVVHQTVFWTRMRKPDPLTDP
ncbi:hypothetical protein ACGFYE_01115 [Streptomyces zaomyceticus]|uniref:hypothetical protein n=1 Tax=Streptomyces zaomyceticus TaxID=68286 RepID=UPI003716843E